MEDIPLHSKVNRKFFFFLCLCLGPQDELLQTLGCDDDIWFVIGCHPKNATEFSARHEQGLREALNHSKVVGLGEIGLDYSGK